MDEAEAQDLLGLLDRQSVGDDADDDAGVVEGLHQRDDVVERVDPAELGVVVGHHSGGEDEGGVDAFEGRVGQADQEAIEVPSVVRTELANDLEEFGVDLVLRVIQAGLAHGVHRVAPGEGGELGGGDERVVDVEQDCAKGGHGGRSEPNPEQARNRGPSCASYPPGGRAAC